MFGCAATGLGCHPQSKRPPLASDGYQAREAGAKTEDDYVSSEHDAVEYCGETSVSLPIVRPTFYYIVDTSGSMQSTMPRSAGHNRYWAARTAIAEMLRAAGDRVGFGVATFPADGKDECAPGKEVFKVHRGDPSPDPDSGADGPMLQALMFNLDKLTPSGSTPTSATLTALKPQLERLGPKTFAFLLTDGVPNCAGVDSCSSDQCSADIDGLELNNGKVCGRDLQCCAAGVLPELCLDGAATQRSLAALAKSGIPTYVVGFPGSDAYADVLDGMARAAGTAREGADQEYYRVSDVTDLAETLTQIGKELTLACTIELEKAPGDRERISVLTDGDLLAPGAKNGWVFSSETSVELRGTACRRWQSGEWDRVQVVEGCDFRVR